MTKKQAVKKDYREFSRSMVQVNAEIRLTCGMLIEGKTRDASLGGALFTTERPLPQGHPVCVTLCLDFGDEHHRIKAEGHVARVDEDGIAISFASISADGLEHLRRVILYNAEDADQVESEFDKHIGLRPVDTIPFS